MAFKEIIVIVDATEASERRVHIASQLAASQQAHLTGVFIRRLNLPALDFGLYTDPKIENHAFHEELQRAVDNEELMRSGAQISFEKMLRQAKLAGEWIVVDGERSSPLAAFTGAADLIIAGPGESGQAGSEAHTGAGELAIASGCPVLVVPYSLPVTSVGSRILVAWNGTREAARAVGDAMPFLEHAAFVELLSVQAPWVPLETGLENSVKIVRRLEQHGIKAERFAVRAPEHLAGEEIIARANTSDCDLIVMGAYGHSRLRELVLGGTTRSILKNARQAVFLSH